MLGKKDWLLTAYLRQNSRMPLTILARKTGIPISTIFDHLRACDGRLYNKYIALLNFSILGFGTKVHLLLRVPKPVRERVQEFLFKHWNVNSLYKVNNGYDFLAEGVFRHVQELETFLDKLEDEYGVKGIEVHYIVDDLKREAFLSDPQVIDYVMNERRLVPEHKV